MAPAKTSEAQGGPSPGPSRPHGGDSSDSELGFGRVRAGLPGRGQAIYMTALAGAGRRAGPNGKRRGGT